MFGADRLEALLVDAAGADDLLAKVESVLTTYRGAREPFDDATIQALYPTHAEYVQEVNRSALSAFAHGFITLRAYVEQLIDALFADVPPQ